MSNVAIDSLTEDQLKSIVTRLVDLDPNLVRLVIAQMNQEILDAELSKANLEIAELKSQLETADDTEEGNDDD